MTLETWYLAVVLAAAGAAAALAVAMERLGNRVGFVDQPRTDDEGADLPQGR